jgi:hypothetical protein
MSFIVHFVKACLSNVEVNLTALSAVPGLLSSSNGHVILQCFMLVFLKHLLCNGCF